MFIHYTSTPKRQIWHRITDDDGNSDTDSNIYDRVNGDDDDDDDDDLLFTSTPKHKVWYRKAAARGDDDDDDDDDDGDDDDGSDTDKDPDDDNYGGGLNADADDALRKSYSPITLLTRISTVNFIAQIVLTYF